jgi:serine/threonine protein kinase
MAPPPRNAGAERTLGKYQIVRPLKLGGTAAIYLAVMRGENGFSREVVIKRPLPHLIADPRSRLMFVDEAHIAARLSHPNICQVLDLVSRDDEVYLVLEYLRGVDLREIVKRCGELGRLMPVEVALWMAIEVAAGLDFAHGARGLDGRPLALVHRDVSPKNIRVTFSGSVKVIDFGIARAINRATETAAGTIKGTLGYMSPEQILGEQIDLRSDLFAFGICLFQMLTGVNPVDGATLKERVWRLTQAPIPSPREFNPALDEELARVVGRCLERDPTDRYPDMAAAQAELDRCLSRMGVVSPRKRLIRFLEEIFPDQHELDRELEHALTRSSISARIDTEQRLLFPDDQPTLPSGAGGTAATVAEGGVTLRDEPPTIPATAARPAAPWSSPPPTSLDDTRPVAAPTPGPSPGATRMIPGLGPAPAAVRSPGLAVLVGAAVVAGLGLLFWAQREVRVQPLPAEVEASAPSASADGGARPDTPDAGAARASLPERRPPDAASSGGPAVAQRAPVREPDRSEDVAGARRFFRAAVRLARAGRSEDARLLYHLAYARGGARPDPGIFLNLGLMYDQEGDSTKAAACLRGYLARVPSPPSAAQLQSKLASYGSVPTRPCVEPDELATARAHYARRGAVIDGWVEATGAGPLP